VTQAAISRAMANGVKMAKLGALRAGQPAASSISGWGGEKYGSFLSVDYRSEKRCLIEFLQQTRWNVRYVIGSLFLLKIYGNAFRKPQFYWIIDMTG